MLILQVPSDDLPIDALLAKTTPPVKKSEPAGSTFKAAPQRRSQTPITTSVPPVSRAPSQSPIDPSISQEERRRGLPQGMTTNITHTLPNGTTLTVPRWLRTAPVGNSKSWARATTSHHGSYASPQFPNGLLPNMSNVEKFVVVGCHAVACDRFAELNASTLSQGIYWDFKINPLTTARQLLHYYAKDTAAKFLELGLDAYGKDSKIYKELMAAKYDETKLKSKEKLEIDAIIKQGKIKHRDQAQPRKAKDAPAAGPPTSSTPVPPPAVPVPPPAAPVLTSSGPVDSLGRKIPARIKRAKGFENSTF